MSSSEGAAPCPLCQGAGGEILWHDGSCRVVLVDDADYPGFCRVILARHVAEMSDLPEAGRVALMRVVFAVEAALRECLQPDKVNLASFGNVVPHLHWHVIPRWRDDPHFPQAIWGARQRNPSPRPPVDAEALRRALFRALSPSAR